MKAGISIAIIIAIIANVVIGILIYHQHQQHNNTPSTTATSTELNETTDSLTKKMLIGTTPTTTTADKARLVTEQVANQQLSDNERLDEMAQAASTTISKSEMNQAWQRELYNHTDAAGLAAYITSLGTDEATYRAELEKQLVTNAFLQAKALPRVTDTAVRAYYDSLPVDERDEFSYMETSIKDTLLALAVVTVRTELLAE